jgi:nitrogen regulatory protein PII
MVIIGGRKLKESLITALGEAGAKVFNVVYGRGFVKRNNFLTAFGMVEENDKVVIMCIIKRADCDGAFDVLNQKFRFDKPDTGIAFCVPIDALKF